MGRVGHTLGIHHLKYTRNGSPSSGRWGECRSHLVQALAADVAHGLLDALGQGLSCPLNIDDGGHSKDHLVSVVGSLTPLHELWNSPVELKGNVRGSI